jgi:hypothetical protein
MIYLYLKEHKQTGMKYLGKTEQDPFKYQGSGTYWTRHLKKYGNDVDTKIIGEYETNDEVAAAGKYYSELWNIVESEEWANLKPESGDGGGAWNKGMIYDEEMKQRIRVPHPKAQGSKQSASHSAAKSKALKGRVPGFGGKEHTEDTINHLRKMALQREKKECPYCKRIIAVNVYARYHGDNCKHK